MTAPGGDEIGALVFDVGSYSTKAGFAGEDSPKAVFPTMVGHRDKDGSYAIGDTELTCRRDFMEIRSIMKQGVVEDWDGLQKIWEHTFSRRLRVDSKEFPVLYAVPSFATRDMREKICELMFEVYQVPALYLSHNAVLTSFAFGRSTALVFDSGHEMTSVVPVYEGHVLKKNMMKQGIAGAYLIDKTEHLLEHELGIDINPYYLVDSKEPVREGQPANFKKRDFPNTTKSFQNYMKQKVVVDFIESVCQVSERPYDDSLMTMIPTKSFEFPDGYNRNFGAERFRIPELMFNPKSYPTNKNAGIDPSGDQEGSSEKREPEKPVATDDRMGVHELISRCIASCDVDLRPALWNNLILTGGSTLFPSFSDRMHHELTTASPGSKIKLIAPNNIMERKYSTWIGGSILASLGTFHQMWVSRQEYEEQGKLIVEKRCS